MTIPRVLCRTALVALFSLLTVVCAVQAASEGRVNGTVVDQDGKPLEGVLVVVTAEEVDRQRTAETNKKGRFTVVLLDATRTFDITLAKEGYVTRKEPLDPVVGGLLKKEWQLVRVDRLTEESKEQLAVVEARNKAAKIYNEGVKAFNEEDNDTAEAKFLEALEEAGGELPQANLGLARIYREREDWERTVTEAAVVVAAMPEDPIGQLILFDAQLELGRLDEASATIDRLVEMDTERRTAVRVFEVGVANIRANDLDQAKRRFEQVLELAPDIKEAHINLGHIHRAQGDFEAVKRHANAYLELAPDAPSALSLIYQAEQALGNSEAAEAAFQKLAAADPELVTTTFYEEGMTLFNGGQREEAKSSFERVLAADPDFAMAHYYLGLIHVGSDDEKAKRYLDRFLELAPDHPEAATAREVLSYYE